MSISRMSSAAAIVLATVGAVPAANAAPVTSVVLVHGAFADGSGWKGVYEILKKDGYDVTVVQNATTSLKDDVAATRRAIADAKGDVILVGHSYGGAVITEAGNDPKVAGLVYIAAFAPAEGESVAALTANPPPGAAVPPVLPPENGSLLLDKSKFAAAFAADVKPEEAAFMAASQTPWGLEAFKGVITHAAWADKPAWFLVASEDKMIPPAAERQMAERAHGKISEIPSSHAVYVSHPNVVAALIEKAAQSAQTSQSADIKK
jgi:pimeloyl-ACP methyl ester carboxylesterase